jgi:hypothetical protein
LSFAYKHQDILRRNKNEKIYTITNSVPLFARQFTNLPFSLLGLVVDVCLEIFSLYFLIQTRGLSEMITLTIIFVFTNLIWLGFFAFLIKKTQQRNSKKKLELEKKEREEIKFFMENLDFDSRTVSLEKINKTLNENSEKIKFSSFVSVVSQLPDLIIPGITVLFLFLYHNVGEKE